MTTSTTLKMHHDIPWDRVRSTATTFVVGAVLATGLTVQLTGGDDATPARPEVSAASADSITSGPADLDRISADAAERRLSGPAQPEPVPQSPLAVEHRAEIERAERVSACVSGPISPDSAERCLAN